MMTSSSTGDEREADLVGHPRFGNNGGRDEIELFLRDAYAAGANAAHRRSLVTAMEYAEREAPKLRTTLRAEQAKDREDAERWRQVQRGLFVTPHPIDPECPGEVQVVFQSGSLDEVAAKLYHAGALKLNGRGIAFDVLPVVDAAIRAARATLPETAEPTNRARCCGCGSINVRGCESPTYGYCLICDDCSVISCGAPLELSPHPEHGECADFDDNGNCPRCYAKYLVSIGRAPTPSSQEPKP